MALLDLINSEITAIEEAEQEQITQEELELQDYEQFITDNQQNIIDYFDNYQGELELFQKYNDIEYNDIDNDTITIYEFRSKLDIPTTRDDDFITLYFKSNSSIIIIRYEDENKQQDICSIDISNFKITKSNTIQYKQLKTILKFILNYF